MKKTARLTQGSVAGHLITMSLPMIGGILAMQMFNVVDTWFVAQLGDAELAAMSFTFPVVFVLISVAIGLGAGTSSVLARAIGRGDWDRVQRLTTDSLILSGVITVVLSVVGYFTITPLFRLLGATDDLIVLIADYMKIWYLSIVFLIVPMVGLSAIRATGDTRFPSMVMILSSVLNIVLDPLFIFGWGPIPGMGIKGAAIATLISRAVTLFAALYMLHGRANMITLQLPARSALMDSWRRIMHVGLPAAGTNTIIPISIGIVTAMLATYGANTVAGFGVASRIESIVLVVFYAMSAVIGPFVGQNLSAGNRERIFEALRLCTLFSLGLGVVLSILLAFGGGIVSSWFSDDREIVSVAQHYLWIVPISYGTGGMVMVMNAAFNAIGQPMPAVVVSAMRMMGLYVPLAFVGSYFFAVDGIFFAYSLANVVCGIGAYIWLLRAVSSHDDLAVPTVAPVSDGGR